MTEKESGDENGMPAKPTATPDEVEVATALWNEYKHRHDLVWKIVFQVTTAVVILSVVPYLAPKMVRKALDGWIVAPPVLATVLVLFSLALVIHELKLLAKIRGPYWRLQKDRFGVSHETVPGTGHFLSEKWTQGFVYAYFIGLAVLSATNSVICARSWIY